GLRRRHANYEVARDLEVAGAGKLEMQRDITDRRRREREATGEILSGGEGDRAFRRRGKRAGAARRQLQAVVAGAAFEIVDDDPDLAGVAGRQTARQGHHRDNRVAHRRRAGRRSQLLRRVSDRHQAQLTLEIGNVELDFSSAILVELDDAGEQRDDAAALVRQTGDRATRKLVAAAAPHADAVRIRGDQAAVEVAQLDAEPALAEIIFLGRGTIELGQLQHRFVDGGERDIRILIRRKPRYLDPDFGGAARPDDIGRAERGGQ